MPETFTHYLDSVRLWIDDLTEGEVDYEDLIDFADGDCSPAECHADGISAKECAKMILEENGADWL